jgi:hypothetical protein
MKDIDIVRAVQQSAELNALTMLCKDFYRCSCGLMATRSIESIPVRVTALDPFTKIAEEYDHIIGYARFCDSACSKVDPNTYIDTNKLEVIGPVKWFELSHAKLARRFNALLLRETP